MNHSADVLPGIAGSVISAGCSLAFLGVSLLETHPAVQDIAVCVSLTAAVFSICASAVTIWKNLKK